MLIECTIRRKNGSTVNFGETEYKFAPTEKDPRHLCEVKEEAHIERLLSIKESFVAADKEILTVQKVKEIDKKLAEEQAAADAKKAAAEAAQKAAAQTPAEDDTEGQSEQLVEVAKAAAEVQAEKLEEKPAVVEPPADEPTIRDKLVAQAIAAGIKEPHKMSTKRLIAALDK